MSAVLGDDGMAIDLFFCHPTAPTWNISGIYRTMYDGAAWSEPDFVGLGRAPAAIHWEDGGLRLYSNPLGLTSGPLHCVDEWAARGGNWSRRPVAASALDGQVEPEVVEDGRGDGLLIYDIQDPTEGSRPDLRVEVRSRQGDWTHCSKVAVGVPWHFATRYNLTFAIGNPSATVHGAALDVFYISRPSVYMVHGTIR